MKLSLIEDCSPYYIRFSDPNIESIFHICDNEMLGKKFPYGFAHHLFSKDAALQIKDSCGLFNIFDLNLKRISMFVSQPGLYYRAHKDGFDHHFSLNYTYKILDKNCVTNWYSDTDLQSYSISSLGKKSRECVNFNPNNHTPLKTMTAEPNELILFNTEIFHDWNNKESKNIRMILTLRLKDYSLKNTMFEDAREKLFELI